MDLLYSRLACIYLRMLKRIGYIWECSRKRQKATAKADALRAVIEKTKPITQFSVCQMVYTRGGQGSEVPEPTPAGSCAFLSDPDPEPNICEKPEPGSAIALCFRLRGLCTRHFLRTTLLNFGCIDGSRCFNRSRILKLENFSDPDSKILEQERSRSVKMWLQSLLPSRRAPSL